MPCRRCTTARATSTRFSRNAVGERGHIHGGAARSRREPVERRIQEAGALQHAWRQHLADRRDGPRPARRIWPAHVRPARLGRHPLRRSRPAGARLRLPRRRSGDGLSAGLGAGTGGSLRLHGQLHRGHRQTGDAASGKRARHFRLAHARHRTQRRAGRPAPGHGGKRRALARTSRHAAGGRCSRRCSATRISPEP